VHALLRSASNLVFGFDFSATALKGSKGIAQPTHRYYRSQALEEGGRNCMLAVCWRRCTALKTQSTPYRKVINDAGVPLLES